MIKESKTSARLLLAAERRQKALELRKAGASLKQIATQLGVTFQAVSKTLHVALSEIQEHSEQDAVIVRRLEAERLDAMLLGLWPKARSGAEGSVDRVVRIMERRARLFGLDEPTKTQVDQSITEESRVIVHIPDNGRFSGDDEGPAGDA